MSAEVRRAKKTFNVISVTFIDQLLRLFSDCPTLPFFKSEIEKFAKDPANDHVPAANFFSTMNTETKIPPSEGTDKIVVGELIIRKDERVFGKDTGVDIPAINALGLNDMWPKLSPENKEMVWGYLIRMARHSAQVVFGMRMLMPEMQEAMKSVKPLAPGATEPEFREFTKSVHEAVSKVNM